MTTPRQINERITEGAIRDRQGTLREAIAALLPEPDRETAFSALSTIPPHLLHLRALEWEAYMGALPVRADVDLPPEPPIPSIDYSETVAGLRGIKPDYRRNPARLRQRLQSPRPLEALAQGKGQPPYPYRDLILFDIVVIERLTGRPFTYTWNEYESQIRGKKVDTLMAALDCQLFASGAPIIETAISIFRKNRDKNNQTMHE